MGSAEDIHTVVQEAHEEEQSLPWMNVIREHVCQIIIQCMGSAYA